MLDIALLNRSHLTSDQHHLRARLKWALWYLGLLGIAGVIALLMVRGTPTFAWIAWLLLIAGVALIIYQPRYGIYLTLFWGLAGDSVMMTWYPFHKNFSSAETLLYLHDSAILSPLEFYLILTFLVWFLRESLQRRLRVFQGPLFWPTMIFSAFVGFGLVYGIARGGNVNIALWESRAMFYLPLLLVLVSNLFQKRAHIENAIWAIIGALFVEGLYGSYLVLFYFKGDLSTVESLTEHSAALHMGTALILAAAIWLFNVSWQKRLLLFVLLPPILLTILGAQRRSAYVAIMIALILLVIYLYRERRKVFWFIAPLSAILGLLYLGVFWNSGHPLGDGAQAIKSVIAEDQADYHDQLSNQYRDIENYNLTFTLKQEPLTGVGFGNKFYIVIPMPDISGFRWWEYMPHNSVVYFWLKSGVGGFIALLLLIGLSVMQGMRATVRLPNGFLKAITFTLTSYIIMHFIYAYVDISWEAQSMLYVGFTLGVLNSVEHIAAKDTPARERRWPWQQELPQPAGLLPVSD